MATAVMLGTPHKIYWSVIKGIYFDIEIWASPGC